MSRRFEIRTCLREVGRSALVRSGPLLLIAIVIGSLSVTTCHGQKPVDKATGQVKDAPRPTTSARVTREAVEKLAQQLEESPGVEEDLKNTLLETCRQALQELDDARTFEDQASKDQTAVSSVQARLEQLKTGLTQPTESPLDDIADDASLADLVAALASRQTELQQASERLTQLEAEPGQRDERRAQIVAGQASYPTRRADIDSRLNTPAADDESPHATAARRALARAQLAKITAEAAAHQAELAKFDAEDALGLPAMQTQAAQRRVAHLNDEIRQLNDRIAKRRHEDANFFAKSLRRFAQSFRPGSPLARYAGSPLARQALETADLADSNVTLADDVALAGRDVDDAKQELDDLRALDLRTRDRVKRVGLTNAIGQELRKQLQSLDDVSSIRRESRERQETMHQLEVARIEFEDRLPTLKDEIASLESREQLTDDQQLRLRVLQDRLATIEVIIQNHGEQFNKLGQLDANRQEYIKAVTAYRSYISEHVLWIRSNRFIGMSEFADALATATWFFSPTNWLEILALLWSDVNDHLWIYFAATILVVMLVLVQQRFRSNLNEIGHQARTARFFDFYPTVRATVLTIVISILWPAWFLFLGWRLITLDGFARAVGYGLIALAVGFLSLNLVRQICRTQGLGPVHFDWPEPVVHRLRIGIHGLMVVLLPLVFVGATLHALDGAQSRDALERLVFIVSMLVLAHFFYRMLDPETGVFRDYLVRRQDEWLSRLGWLWHPIAFGMPMLLALLAVAGYFYTAYELSWRLDMMIWLLIVLVVLRSFLVRWFLVNHRRLRMEQMRQRRAAERDALAESADGPVAVAAVVSPQEEAAELKVIGEQTRRLIHTGLGLAGLTATWFIWVEVLPALAVLDQWKLWSTTVQVTVEKVQPDGTRNWQTESQVRPFTVGSLLAAAVYAVVTITASRNVPGLVEIVLLQRLPLEPASRYAVRTLTRYVILVVGLIFTFGAIGIGWSNVQWLAAALTVGLGFGLQEIFANFVSGLIILFERPVRIGDVVTIDGVSGTVSRIQIRATTITDWDRKEYIVPNKEFVTGRLLNWTLTDRTNRIVINVGVAYGTDTDQARNLLLQAATEHERILDDPGPIATFEGFGDSTLNLVLRCYLPTLDGRLQTITELHEAIDRLFGDAGIEIAFPQQDINLRSVPDGFGSSVASGSTGREQP